MFGRLEAGSAIWVVNPKPRVGPMWALVLILPFGVLSDLLTPLFILPAHGVNKMP